MNKELIFKNRAKIGLAILIALVFGPMSFLLALGILGFTMAGLAALFALLVVGVANAAIPAVSHQLTVWKFKALHAVVSRAPIETLVNEKSLMHADIKAAAAAVEMMIGEVEMWRAKVIDAERKFGPADPRVISWKEQLVNWEKNVAFRIDALKQGRKSLTEFDDLIDAAEMEWNMAETDRKISKAVGASSDDFERRLKTKTALESVQRNAAQARARLQLALASNDELTEQTKHQPQVHAINYDANGKVLTGDILNVEAKVVK